MTTASLSLPPIIRIKSISEESRFVVQRVYARSCRQNMHELIVGGCIVSGMLSVGDTVTVQPSGATDIIIHSIESHHHTRRRVFGPYESVALKLRWMKPSCTHYSGTTVELGLLNVIARGSIIGRKDEHALGCVKNAQGIIMATLHPGFKSGYTPTLRAHSASVPCTIDLLERVLWLSQYTHIQ